MSKAVLLAVNSKYVHSSLSVRVLAAGVSRYAWRAHEVEVVEATIHHADRDIAGRVSAFAPDVVGVSAYIWNAARLPGLLAALRERLPDAVIVLGGPEASHNAGYWLARGADRLLCGEGERSFPALLDALEGCENVRAETEPEEEPVDPYTEACLASLKGRIAYLETSRGCPFRCAFCLSGGSGVRFFPLEPVKERIDKLSRCGAKTVKLVDRTFNCDPGRAYTLFEYILGLDTDCRFHFEAAADLFDERTISLLAGAPPGRIQLEAGLQSFHKPALRAVSGRMDLERAGRNIRALLRGGNIHIHLDLIAGLPYETLADGMDSFDRAWALGAHTLQLGFLKLLHGSALRGRAAALGIRYGAEPPYEIEGSPWLSAEDIQILKNAENALRHTHNKGRFLSVLRYVLPASGLRPFALFRALGEGAPHHGTPLEEYAGQLYALCAGLSGVDAAELRDRMICDWLGMVKGKNMPPFLKGPEGGRRQAAERAERRLGRKIGRGEAAILSSGRGVFADSADRDPVTGLYRLHFTEPEPVRPA
ncbi:MAG: B12-binding domain-containing radical SAM protein [Oscillospiraceae bacterium]|nr:B12-binding domain-containing radical SAM protein [Oscillospiraceae bacterium]